MNTTYRRAPWADVLYACDAKWWQANFAQLAFSFRGQLWSVSQGARDEFGVRWVKGIKGSGLSSDPSCIVEGLNSGYQAIGLAHAFGAARVVLLGYDYSFGPNGEKHHHPDHPCGMGNPLASRLPEWRRHMATLAASARQVGLEVVNASRRTALRCFPRVELEDALC